MLRVQNEAGEKDFTYNVIVYSPPHLKNGSNNQTVVKLMQTGQFTNDCEIDGIPEPKVCPFVISCSCNQS